MNNISAILGPTNTGKTFFAIKKMLKCDNGVIGFPLRLLARENYEYTKRIVGESKVDSGGRGGFIYHQSGLYQPTGILAPSSGGQQSIES